ncbi:GNAT family N-acetyltransferase [Paucibacter sp. B2R-40]|uniref:GNAT family N-acetyltransferase n=1 Tax=Paucibacter sp. B2R-40 TaxID=2893554 RepID=UPI0021E49316|nr:GNAT family N-acetyltransferase [Paucibacter sp. B2R-40]MCV2355503.1 GNAT family N-acetyltransferase [Paucibacter sp. B2R-40]
MSRLLRVDGKPPYPDPIPMPVPKFKWTRYPATKLHSDQALQTLWDGLNRRGGDLPFLDASAVCAALKNFGDGQEVILAGSQHDQVVALLVLTRTGPLQWSTFQPSQLPLGAWVAESGLELQALTQSLVHGPLSMCLALSITQIDPLLTPRPTSEGPSSASTNCAHRSDDYISTAWVSLVGTFDEYWAARGKNLRQNLRKQRNKLAADGVTTQIKAITASADMAAALVRYGALESAGWKADKGTAIHPDNAQGKFYVKVFEHAASRGEALIYEYLFNEKTVAMNLGLLRGGQLIVLKTAYDESYKTLSPAFLLREEELQAFFAQGHVKRIEYYGKVMDWHTKLTPEARTLYHFTQYRWAWLQGWLSRRQAKAKARSSAAEPANQQTPPLAQAATTSEPN